LETTPVTGKHASTTIRRIRITGNVAYGALFVIIIPALLILWARAIDRVIVDLPAVGTLTLGWAMVAVGLAVIAAGWWALLWYGEGLPMNISPPAKFVTQGIYRVLPHPIYVGFSLMTAGYFMASDLRAGFWLVTPCVALGCTAIVLGYERHDMKKRFGTTDTRAVLRLPDAVDASCSFSDRASAYVLGFLPWLAMHEMAILLGPAPDATEGFLSLKHALPVVPWTGAIYALAYPFVLVAPLCCRRKGELRALVQMGLSATALGTLCFLLFPVVARPHPFEASGMWGRFLVLDRVIDGPAGAFPSFHVLWTFLAAWLYARSFGLKPLWYLLASLMALSCLTAGMSSVANLCGSLAIFAFAVNGARLWQWALKTAERVANSWRAWRIGRMRIIVHAAYSFAMASIGGIIASLLAGEEQTKYLLLVGFFAVLGAGIWGQFLKGNSNLARPFGFFGGLIGGTIGVLVAGALGGNGWLLAGALCVASPFAQAIGRLRCLVQGCCHGRQCGRGQGIVVTQERSRVVYLAHLGNRPIHPTPLYSILYNLILGPLLVRAWTLCAPLPLIIGLYLIVGGMGRFIEESHRGEPQTARFGGLRIYQWLALEGAAIGVFLTTMTGPQYTNHVEFAPLAFAYAVVFGLFTAFSMSVDFPESPWRFSRLAPP
jgi:protein-S-isoprenylcysteine O-methyltransferase Ste14